MSHLWFEIFSYWPQNKSDIIDTINLKPLRSDRPQQSNTSEYELYEFSSRDRIAVCKFIPLEYAHMAIIQEVCVMNYIQHNNICNIKRIYFTKDKKYIYYTYFPCIAVDTNSLTAIHVNQILQDIGAAMCYLHHKNIVHGNIAFDTVHINKAVNKVTKKTYVKAILTDFSQSVKVIPRRPLLEAKFDWKYLPNTTPNLQVPPEVLLNHPCNTKVDTWMYGCLMLYFLTDKHLCESIWKYIKSTCSDCPDSSSARIPGCSNSTFSRIRGARGIRGDSSSKNPEKLTGSKPFKPVLYFNGKKIEHSLVTQYLTVIQNETMLVNIVNDIFANTTGPLKSLEPDRRGLYEMLIRLCLNPNPEKRLISSALKHSLPIPWTKIYREPYWMSQKRRRRKQYNMKQNYIVEFMIDDYINIIRDFHNKSFILERNMLLTNDDLIENIDILWDIFEGTPDSKHLHNLTVALFIDFASHVTILDADNIWMYMICCKFLTYNMYVSPLDLSSFMTIEDECYTLSVMQRAITHILKSLRFNILNEFYW